MAEQRDLPGWPRKRLVKAVRSHLWRYGIRPKGDAWRATWAWAFAIANSYSRIHWPLPFEIAAQYVFLLLAEMQQNHSLRLPYRAGKVVPDQVRALLAETSLALPDVIGKPKLDLKRIGQEKAVQRIPSKPP